MFDISKNCIKIRSAFQISWKSRADFSFSIPEKSDSLDDFSESFWDILVRRFLDCCCGLSRLLMEAREWGHYRKSLYMDVCFDRFVAAFFFENSLGQINVWTGAP